MNYLTGCIKYVTGALFPALLSVRYDNSVSFSCFNRNEMDD